MSNIQEICNYLKSILKLLNNNKELTDLNVNELEEKVKNLLEIDLKVKEIYETIESNLNEVKLSETLSETSKQLINLIDLMIRLIILSNNWVETELISTQNYLTIKLSLIKLISLTIIPYIRQHFQQIQYLFLSIDDKCLAQFDNPLISRQFIYNFTKILINFLNSKSIISRILIEDCFASLIASLMTVKRDSDLEEEKHLVEEQLSELMSSFDQIIVIRNLLLLSRCKAIKWSNNEISRSVSKCLARNSGLICLINAVLDCDQSSQRQTTLHQRYQAIGTIVSAIPQLHCSLTQYYETIGGQVFDLLVSSDTNYHKIGSMIVMGLENRNSKLTQELIIDKILNVFLIPDGNSCLTLNNAIEIIHNLIICRFDSKKFIRIISHLFYIRVIIDETLSHYKTSLNVIIVEILDNIKESVYLLDNILYNNYKLINNFEVYVANAVIGVKYKQLEFNVDKHEFSLKQIDSIVQLVIQLLNKLSQDFKIDLFLILIERMTFSRPSLLTCSLVDSIHENVSLIINNYSEKSIKFVINTFERLAEQQNEVSIDLNGEQESELQPDFDFNDMKQNSLTMCLQIVKILMKEKHKLSDKDINQLKQMIPSLDKLLLSQTFDESLRKTAIELKNQIELNESNLKFSENNTKSDNKFESAMNGLNDPLMPVRAHALIQLKQLIYAKDKHLLENKTQLINALKMCLNDSESYIYLSSVNTLSSLAILCTQDVLPVLIQQFNESERTVEERLKVGEVLVRLSKSIGDFGHHFSKQYINCFLIGVKSREAAIRISSLSNLGQFCSSLRFALKPYIVELMSCVEAVLKTDDSIEVKRSSVLFLHLMLRGIEVDVIEAISQQIKDIYKLLRLIYSTTFDDILQLHSQLAIEEIDRIARDLLKPNKTLINVITL